MKRGSKFLIVALSTLAMAGTAAAQGDGTTDDTTGDGMTDPAGDGTDTTAGDGTVEGDAAAEAEAGGGAMDADMDGDLDPEMGSKPSMTTPVGKIAIYAAVDVNLSKEAVGKPISITPDLWYGVMPKLDIGLAHSGLALNGFWAGGLGGGVCVTGKDNGCGKVYNGPVGIMAHYLLVTGTVDLAADVGIVANSIDPFALGAKVGVLGRYMAGKIAIGFNPNIGIGITKRDEGNKERLNIPVSVMFLASPKIGVGLQSGITGPLDGFGDAYSVPLSVGAMYNVSAAVMAGASFNLLRVAGFEGPGAADLRSLTVFFGFHN